MKNKSISLEAYIEAVATGTLNGRHYRGMLGHRANNRYASTSEGMLQLEFNGKIINEYRYTTRDAKLLQMRRWCKSVANLKEASVIIINTPDY